MAQGLGIRAVEASGASPLVAFLVRQRSQASRAAWLVGALAVATLITVLRLQLGFGSSGVPLVFFLPAIIVVTLVAGLEYGLVSLAASIAIVWFAFLPPVFSFRFPQGGQAVTFILWSVVSVPLVALAYFLRASLQLLIRSESRYREIASVTSDIVWLTDEGGRILQPHPTWSEVTGLAWPAYRDQGWLTAVHEEDRPRLKPPDGEDHHAAEFRLWDADAQDWRWYRARAVAIRGADGRIEEWVTAMSSVHEQKLAREKSEIMIGEARHRLKNLVTIIDALAKSSRQRGAEPNSELEGFLRRFLGRLHALGAAADLVLAGQHLSVDIGAMIRATLAPFIEEDGHRFFIQGPEVQLSEPTGGSLALAMHELATNAIKYGALTAHDGRVSITWSVAATPEGDRVTLEWKEIGGPTPVAPEREGFGTRVIKSVPSREKNGDVTIEYQPDGVYCRIAFTKATPSAQRQPA